MPKITQTPGAALTSLMKKNGLNCNRLAKAIGMSNAIVRLMSLDESPISVAAAFRLAKFFKTKPEFWMSLQMDYSLSSAAKDKALARELNSIVDINHYTFERKARKTKSKSGRPAAKARKTSARKTTRGRKPAKAGAKKAGAKKAGRPRGRPAKSAKTTRARTAKPAGRRGRPSSIEPRI